MGPRLVHRLGSVKHKISETHVSQETYIINVGASALRGGGSQMHGRSPCLTRTRCGGGGHWVSNKGRMLTLKEMECLQGFPCGAGGLRRPVGVTDRQYAKMLGNAFTVSVVGRVALGLLRAVGVAGDTHDDAWQR